MWIHRDILFQKEHSDMIWGTRHKLKPQKL